MTAPTPLDLPDSGPSKQTFELVTVSETAPENNGALGAIQIGETRWMASYTTGTLSREQSDEWRALYSRLRGAGRWFYARDYQRPYPKAYPGGFGGMTRHGGGSFDGSATSWSQAFDGDQNAIVTLNGLPDSFVLGLNDYVGFKWSTTRRALVRAVALSTDLGAGSISVMVEPPIPVLMDGYGGVVPSDAVAYLDKPTCLMRALSTNAPPADLERRGAITTLTVAGLQDLQP